MYNISLRVSDWFPPRNMAVTMGQPQLVEMSLTEKAIAVI